MYKIHELASEAGALKLQQILFYRELGLSLSRIAAIVNLPDFDTEKALERHREELGGRIVRLQELRRTIDRTIAYLKGDTTMENAGIFAGFTPEEEEHYAAEAENTYDPETVRASNRRWKAYSPETKKAILEESKGIYQDMAAAMPEGPGSARAQAVVERWRANMGHFWEPRLDQLRPLAKHYSEDSRFRENLDAIRPGLAEFMGLAVGIYVAGKQA